LRQTRLTFKIDPVLHEMQDTVQDEHRHLTHNILIIHFCAVVCFRRGVAERTRRRPESDVTKRGARTLDSHLHSKEHANDGSVNVLDSHCMNAL